VDPPIEEPVDPSVPEVTVNADGKIDYACPEGYTLRLDRNNNQTQYYCEINVTTTQMRPGQAVNRYRSTAAQGSNPQRSQVNTSTIRTGATEVAS
jgi:hypothetical protein